MAVRYLGRRVRHITPRYVVDRCARWLYEHRYTDAPWLTPQAVAILSTALRRTDNGLEYGSGRTLWFAKRTNSLLEVFLKALGTHPSRGHPHDVLKNLRGKQA